MAKLIISWKHKLVTYSINGKSLLLPTSQNKRPCFATGIFCRCLVEVFFDRFLPSIGTAFFDSKIKSVTVAQTNHLVLPKTLQKTLFFQAKSYISFLLLLVYQSVRSLNFFDGYTSAFFSTCTNVVDRKSGVKMAPEENQI